MGGTRVYVYGLLHRSGFVEREKTKGETLFLPFVPFLLAFILGVHFSTQIDPLFKWVDGGIGLILLIYFSFNSLLQWRVLLFGFAFFILGIQAGEIDQRISNTHYSQFVKPAQQNYFKVVLKRKLSPSKTRERYYVTVKKSMTNPLAAHFY